MTLAGAELSARAREWVCLDNFFSGPEGRSRRDLVWRLADRLDAAEKALQDYPCTCVYDNYQQQIVTCARCLYFGYTEPPLHCQPGGRGEG